MRTLHITFLKEPTQSGEPEPGSALIRVETRQSPFHASFGWLPSLSRVVLGVLSPFDIELIEAQASTQPPLSRDTDPAMAVYSVTPKGLYLAVTAPYIKYLAHNSKKLYLVYLHANGVFETAPLDHNPEAAFNLMVKVAPRRNLRAKLTAAQQNLHVEADRLAERHGWPDFTTPESQEVHRTAVLARAYYHQKHPNPEAFTAAQWLDFAQKERESRPMSRAKLHYVVPLPHI